MNPDTAPKPVSKSALQRRRSSSGDTKNSPSVITDHDPTVSLSLSFSNLGNFAPQGHLDTKTKANEHNEKNNITHNDSANTYNELPGNATDTIGVDTLKASTDDRDGDLLTQSLNLTLPDLVAAGPAPREGSSLPTEGPKKRTKGGGYYHEGPGFFHRPTPPGNVPTRGLRGLWGRRGEGPPTLLSTTPPKNARGAARGGVSQCLAPIFLNPPP